MQIGASVEPFSDDRKFKRSLEKSNVWNGIIWLNYALSVRAAGCSLLILPPKLPVCEESGLQSWTGLVSVLALPVWTNYWPLQVSVILLGNRNPSGLVLRDEKLHIPSLPLSLKDVLFSKCLHTRVFCFIKECACFTPLVARHAMVASVLLNS